MNSRTKLTALILVACTAAIATVAVLEAAPPASPFSALPVGNVYIEAGDEIETTLENVELRTHGDVTFVVGRESKAGAQNKFGTARTWIPLSSIKMMVELP